MSMKLKTETIVNTMFFFVWFVCIGLLVKAGALLIPYGLSIFNEQAAKDLYKGMTLFAFMDFSFIQYSMLVFYKVFLLCVQAYIAFQLTELLRDFNLASPFNDQVVKLMEKICIAIIFVWFIVLLHNIHLKILEKTVGLESNYLETGSLIWLGMVYVLAQIFRRGIEIQSDNEYTI